MVESKAKRINRDQCREMVCCSCGNSSQNIEAMAFLDDQHWATVWRRIRVEGELGRGEGRCQISVFSNDEFGAA